MSFVDRFRRTRNPAVPLPWRDGKTLPSGFTRPPSTEELTAQRRAARPQKWILDPLPPAPPLVLAGNGDDDVGANDAGPLDGENVFRGPASPGLTAWLDGLHGNRASGAGDVGAGGVVVRELPMPSRAVRVGTPHEVPSSSVPSALSSLSWVGQVHMLSVGDVAVWVLGDIGGHRRCFDDVLVRLGVVGSEIPAGVVIVQVGDLIGGRNGLNRYVLGRVDALMAENPGQWVQLMGNWESRHLPGFMPFDPRTEVDRLDGMGVATLRRWWGDGSLQLAAAARTGGRDVLLTHAGLTSWMWRDLGEPRSALAAAEVLNEAGRYATGFVGQSGEMCAPPRDSALWDARYLRPGPLWASTKELWTSWHGELVMPFDQVVGHTAPFYFNRDSWSPYLEGLAPEVLACAVPSRVTRQVTFSHRCGAVIHSIDPQLHARAAVDAVKPLDLGVGQRLR